MTRHYTHIHILQTCQSIQESRTEVKHKEKSKERKIKKQIVRKKVNH